MRIPILLLLVLTAKSLFAVDLEFVGPNTNEVRTICKDELDNLYFVTYQGSGSIVYTGNPGEWAPLHTSAFYIIDYTVLNSEEHYYITSKDFKLMRSVDGGLTYTTLSQVVQGGLAVSDRQLLSVTRDPFVYRSLDHGDTWSKEQVSSDPFYVGAIEGDGSALFITLVSAIDRSGFHLLSKDYGHTWSQSSDPYMGIGVVQDGVFYGMKLEDPGLLRSYLSTDFGTTWQRTFGITGMGSIASYGRYVIISNTWDCVIGLKPGYNFQNMGFRTLGGIYDIEVVGRYLYLGTSLGLYRVFLDYPNGVSNWDCFE